MWHSWNLNPSLLDSEPILFLPCWVWGMILGLSKLSVRVQVNRPLYEGISVTELVIPAYIHRCTFWFFGKNMLIMLIQTHWKTGFVKRLFREPAELCNMVVILRPINSKAAFCAWLVCLNSTSEFRVGSQLAYWLWLCNRCSLLLRLLVSWVGYKLAVASKTVCVDLSEITELGYIEVERGAIFCFCLFVFCLLDEPEFLIDVDCWRARFPPWLPEHSAQVRPLLS